MASATRRFTAFADQRQIASGSLRDVALAMKARFDVGDAATALIFDDDTGEETDLDLHGTVADVFVRLRATSDSDDDASADALGWNVNDIPPFPRPGRPKLGVVSREVTLLPQHWEWLAAQPGGASAALRRLVHAARRDTGDAMRQRRAQEAAYKVMRVLAGNMPNFEEASRALFAADMPRVKKYVADWPVDVRTYLLKLSEDLEPSNISP